LLHPGLTDSSAFLDAGLLTDYPYRSMSCGKANFQEASHFLRRFEFWRMAAQTEADEVTMAQIQSRIERERSAVSPRFQSRAEA
jgi:hypothetical protein